MIQLVGPLVLATACHEAPYLVRAVSLVLLAIVGIAAALFMDNLDHGIEVSAPRGSRDPRSKPSRRGCDGGRNEGNASAIAR